MNWPEWVGAIGGVIGAAAGIAGFIIAKRALDVSRQSVQEARRSADAGVRSADAAEDSARHAQDVAKIESDRRDDERERWHRELAPPLPAQLTFEYRENSAVADHVNAWGTVTIGGGRDYRGEIVGEYHCGGEVHLGNVLLRPNRPHEFFIEDVPSVMASPSITFVRFRLSPLEHAQGDAVRTWQCRCADPHREPHWDISVSLAGPTQWP